MVKRIHLSLARMGGYEQAYIQEAFDTNWIAPLGPNITGFEKDLEQYLGEGSHVVTLVNGTAAIHLGLLQLGVSSDDEVICQSFTFSATANPITYQKGKPVFVDSDPDSWNMSPEYLRIAIEDRLFKTGKKPKAIIIVDLYGMPAKMDEILTIANEYSIPVLEDSAEALGSVYKGQKCGTFGHFSVISFNGNKIITTSGGGALVCKTAIEAEQTYFYATQARDNAPYYQHSKIGYNYRMSNVSAGIGRGQMRVLNNFVSRRREINQIYREFLSDIPGITFHTNPSDDFNSNYWLTSILIDPVMAGFTNKDLIYNLEQENIESRRLWKPLHLQPVFIDNPFYGNGVSESFFERGVCLPSGASLTDEDIERVATIIRSLYVKRTIDTYKDMRIAR